MKHDKFLYSDGRHVVVTESTLQTKGAQYQLKGITNFGLAIVKGHIVPGIILILLGGVLFTNAYLQFIPDSFLASMSLSGFTPNIQFILGATLVIAGAAYLFFTRKRYAVRIETAEGNKNVIISEKKEYVDQILYAIRRARVI